VRGLGGVCGMSPSVDGVAVFSCAKDAGPGYGTDRYSL
jgi:hypothetical protein